MEAKHSWVEMRGHWQCANCMAVVTAPGQRDRRDKKGCQGHAGPLLDLLWRPQGHSFLVAETEGTLLVSCMRCGCYASERVKNLGQPCPGWRSLTGARNLRALAAGNHPFDHAGDGRKNEGLWDLAKRALAPREQLALALATQDATAAAEVAEAVEASGAQRAAPQQTEAARRGTALWGRVLARLAERGASASSGG